MIVNKCDNCGTDFKDGEFPGWFQITADRGFLIVNANKQVVKYAVLDFCCDSCLSSFFKKLESTMEAVRNEQSNQASSSNQV